MALHVSRWETATIIIFSLILLFLFIFGHTAAFGLEPKKTNQKRPKSRVANARCGGPMSLRLCLDVVGFTLIHVCWCGLGWSLVQILLQSTSTHVDWYESDYIQIRPKEKGEGGGGWWWLWLCWRNKDRPWKGTPLPGDSVDVALFNATTIMAARHLSRILAVWRAKLHLPFSQVYTSTVGGRNAL